MKACKQCPWRLSNQGKRHFGSFYTKKNLTRLWNQIRRGGGMQSCHLTDPSHPDHLTAGCHRDAETRECPGSVLLVLNEVRQHMADETGLVSKQAIERYQKERRRRWGLTKSGILYWVVQRIQLGGKPMFGGPKLPEVEADDGVGLPVYLREG